MNRSENPEIMRLFYALWPDETTRAQLAELQHGLKGRKTKRANLHMTLAFLGEQPEPSLAMLQGILQDLSVPDMSLMINHTAYRKRQRMVWAGMHEVPESLFGLQRDICTGLEQCGIAFDQRNHFKPHITLARDAVPMEALHFEPIAWRASQVSLVQSVNDKTGVSYHVLASQFSRTNIERSENRTG
jgi:RNA 2',3'-cyclic 3'-phosphodiesterase